MNKRRINQFMASALSLILILLTVNTQTIAHAKGASADISGTYYEFDEKNEYGFSAASPSSSTGKNAFGALSVSGNFTQDGTSFIVKEDVLSLTYSFDKKKLDAGEEEWHLVDDSCKKVNGIELEKQIKSGALILQTSLDNKTWVTEQILTDVFSNGALLEKPFYLTKDIQQQQMDGCHYRVILVYKVEIKTGSHKVGFVNVDDIETKRVAEVYEFHAVNKDKGPLLSVSDTPRKELGVLYQTEKDNGYNEGNNPVIGIQDLKDPHFGWVLGNFTINGYTRETSEKDVPVFLKNVGDKVVLWFTLKQDINCLNGKSTLSIAEDSGAYDQHFGIQRTYFGRGTLIIRYTDYQGVKHDPIIYTNFLEANTLTGADTRVQLFEEGDYEVSLDYEIKNNPRQVGSVSVVPTYTDYKITFSFKIRNGNCMVFPFDTKTGNELSDFAITENGFRLDMAKSRYLTIDVEKQVLRENSDGTFTTDTRFNRPAKDNEEYTDEGIYIFTVKNLFTGSSGTKTIYVGTNKYLRALANSNMTLSDLNEKILRGYTVQDNGTLVEPVVEEETEVLPTEAPIAETPAEEEPVAEAPAAATEMPEETAAPVKETPVTVLPSADVEEKPGEGHTEKNNADVKKPGSSAVVIVPIAIALLVVVFFVLKKKKAPAKISNAADEGGKNE